MFSSSRKEKGYTIKAPIGAKDHEVFYVHDIGTLIYMDLYCLGVKPVNFLKTFE